MNPSILKLRHTAACDDYRMGRCEETAFRRQLQRLGYTPAEQDREIMQNSPVYRYIPARQYPHGMAGAVK